MDARARRIFVVIFLGGGYFWMGYFWTGLFLDVKVWRGCFLCLGAYGGGNWQNLLAILTITLRPRTI